MATVAKKTFSKGDVVQLKSGGPRMTVSHPTNESGMVVCVWFKGSSRESGNFDSETLILFQDPE